MPIYEYACESCGHRFEKLMKIGAEPPPCDECGAVDVKKRVSASAFVLKGGGWYKDHYGLKKGGGSSADKSSTGGDGAKAASGDGGGAAKKLDTMQKAAKTAPAAPATPSKGKA